MDPADVENQLGGFALGEVLASLDLDHDLIGNVQGQLGLTSSAFSRESIYADRFMDDVDDDPGQDNANDLEAQVDREMYSERFQKQETSGGSGGNQSLLRGEEDNFDDESDADVDADGEVDEEENGDEEHAIKNEPVEDNDIMLLQENGTVPQSLAVEPIRPPPKAKTVNIAEKFPEFAPGTVLDFTSLFFSRNSRKRKKMDPKSSVALPGVYGFCKAPSTKEALSAPLKRSQKKNHPRTLVGLSNTNDDELEEEEIDSEEELIKDLRRTNERTTSQWPIPVSGTAFDLAELDNWEEKIMWGPGSSRKNRIDVLAPRNSEFQNGDWLKGIIWDARQPYRDFKKLSLNMSDTRMLFEVHSESPSAALPTSQLVDRDNGLDPFNLSNDREYEVTKDTKKKIRQTFGLLEVQHAYPAQKLQLPFYKTRLTKADCRSFHRPSLQFPANICLTITKSRSSKKRKDKSGNKIRKGDSETLRHMSDITLKDTSSFVLWEYCEENPPIISSVGMGSIIVNYYRKRDATDDFVPQLDLGEPLLLETTDESPFKAFGYVDPGQTVPTLYNNLIRAPLFQHKPQSNDFLMIRCTIEGESKYYIREIKSMFIVGQTYPLVEVPGPHSRKITTLIKNRLQTIAFKLVAKNPHHRIKVHRLTKYFPDQNDLQMRQRLKEFMEFNRKGPDQGFWMIKKHIQVPDETELLKLATPEMVCLAESMQVGLRHLQDAGYGQAEEGGAGDDDSKLDIEQQLAPWITTKNFINANANKAMLKLHGDGDPTGRGEAFSFLRISMKDIFLRAGEHMETRLAQMESRPKSAHRYNVQEQQDVYKEEIARIWKTQFESLSNPVEPILTEEDDLPHGSRNMRGDLADIGTPAPMVGTPGEGFMRAGSIGSRLSSPDRDDAIGLSGARTPYGGNKVLRVKRLVLGKWETEIVRDPSVISAYVRQRQLIDEEQTHADDLLPSDDEGKNERRKKRLKEQLDKLKRNQERRLARKNQKLGIPNGEMGLGGKRMLKTETTRICGNCGQRGHMKTSKKLCPRYNEFNAPKNAEPSSSLPSSFSGGLALPGMGGPPLVSAPKPVKATLKLKLGTGSGTGAGSPENLQED